jgi:isopentenyl phosphate kinase
MYLIKFGGSVLTDKTKAASFKQETMNQLALELHKAKKQYILVHGAGSFGHILAKKYHLSEGYTTPKQYQGFALTHAQVQLLNLYVLNALHIHHIPAVSIPPHALLTFSNHQPTQVDFSLFHKYIKTGFTPVTFGDVVLDETRGFSICSGDVLIQILAAQLKPEKVIFVLDEDGLYTSNPKIDATAEFIPTATIQDLKKYSTSENTYADVTRGMEGKLDTIQSIAKMGIDTILLNGNKKNRLYEILIGQNTRHTLICGGKE